MATLLRTDRNGTQYFEGPVECDRCSGKGIYYIGVHNGRLLPSWVDNGVCFKCGGTGKIISKYKVYTPEYEAKLEAKRAAKRAEQERIWAEQEAQREAERRAREEREEAERRAREEQERAEKAISRYVGEVGERLDMQATYIGTARFEVPSFSGFGTETMCIHMFKDAAGNKLVWKTAKGLPIGIECDMPVKVRGTIKEHKEYREEKQTVLTRCKVEEVKA